MTFQKDGYEILNDVIPDDEINRVKQEISTLSATSNRGGIRNAEKLFPSIKSFVHSQQLFELANTYLSGAASIVRVILFDKNPENNWLVTWHQDKTVAVSQPFEMEGWGPWSIKDHTHHVQPPESALNQMVTFRIHLDPTDENNGCLKVIPGSHQFGVLPQKMIGNLCKDQKPISCSAREGSILVMRPHLVHASSKATIPGNRRILHVEYSDYRLPPGVSWA